MLGHELIEQPSYIWMRTFNCSVPYLIPYHLINSQITRCIVFIVIYRNCYWNVRNYAQLWCWVTMALRLYDRYLGRVKWGGCRACQSHLKAALEFYMKHWHRQNSCSQAIHSLYKSDCHLKIELEEAPSDFPFRSLSNVH